MKDFFGQELQVGDTIAYVTRRGSVMAYNEGIIENFREIPCQYLTGVTRPQALIVPTDPEQDSGCARWVGINPVFLKPRILPART